MANTTSKNYIDSMDDFFKKAPALPVTWREFLVKVSPWLALVFGIIGVIGGLAAVGLLTALSPLAIFGGTSGVASYGGGVIAGFIWLASAVLEVIAFPGLKARKIVGWNWLFWSQALSVLGSVVAGSLGSAILGFLLGFYILFQIRSYYK
ncbi:MAG TPA: hypothetical protein VM077_04900 [Candidatus Limnocylindrales bacterium]|nr:hypothetical protein [Candidatus Limnocylindrales bacterium]